MENYEIRFKRSVARDLRGIPNPDVARILQRIALLSENPRPSGCEKLTAKEHYRVRQGHYRIVYEIADDELTVIIIKIGHRLDICR